MTGLSGIPPHLIERAAALPENSGSRDALERALSASRSGEPVGVRRQENVAQTGTQTPRWPQKRRGVPNQTELRYAREVLEPMLRAGDILRYEFEAVTWHLPNVGTYTPDYLIVLPDNSLCCAEVKGGHVRPQSLVRWKAHSAARPWIRWVLTQYVNREWTVLHLRPRV